MDGFVEDLPQLNMQRYNSGCSHYTSDGMKVCLKVNVKLMDKLIIN